MLDLRQLDALCAVADHGSTAAAARSLNWSQPTIVHHLRALSRATGADVVRSSSSGTTLTIAGRLWLPHARAITHRARAAVSDVRASLEAKRRTLRFGIFPSAAPKLLPVVMSALPADDVRAEIVEDELAGLLGRLDRLELDAAVIYSAPTEDADASPTPGFLTLFTEKFWVLFPAGHRLARVDTVSLAELSDEVWIVGDHDDDPVEQAFRRRARAAGFTPVPGPRSDDYSVVVAYVAAGLGLAIVPELALPVGRSDVRAREVSGMELTRHVLLATAPTLDQQISELIREALERSLVEHY